MTKPFSTLLQKMSPERRGRVQKKEEELRREMASWYPPTGVPAAAPAGHGMSITIKHRDGVEILKMTGDFSVGRHIGNPRDLQGRPLDDLRLEIEGLFARGLARIVLDLERVKFIDSAGLGELIACRKRAVELGGDIRILHPGRHVQEVLVLTLLTDVFEIFHDEDAAVGAFTPAP